MTKSIRVVSAMALMMLVTTVRAGVITDGDAVFDDANDLLKLQGTYISADVDINEFLFDWDGALNSFDFSGASLLFSSVGGTLSTPASGFDPGSLSISGLPGAPLPLPASFEFLLSIPGADDTFLSVPVDFYVRDGSGGSDFTNVAFLTPRSANLAATSVPVPATLVLLGLGLLGLGLRRSI